MVIHLDGGVYVWVRYMYRKSWVSGLKHAISDYQEMVGKRERIVGCPDGKGLIKIEVLSAQHIAILSGTHTITHINTQYHQEFP